MKKEYPKEGNIYSCDDNDQITGIFIRSARGNGKSTQDMDNLKDILEEKASKHA